MYIYTCIYIHTTRLKCNNVHRPSVGLANQPQLNPATHQEAACREYFIDLDKKYNIS